MKNQLNFANSPSYIPSLDGIRAVAVLLVIIAHSGFGDSVPGGFGVSIFFFLSGYLITTLLEKEFAKASSINIKHFFIRRFFRLFPVLFVALMIGYLLAYFKLVTGGVSVSGFLYQLFYLANYNKIFQWASETPEGLGILWSLAVEEHFYIFFPTIYLILRKYFGVNVLLYFIASVCVIVLLWRYQLIYDLGQTHPRTYYSTDTRIDSILYGCFFALCFNPLTNFYNTSAKQRNTQFYLLMTLGISLILFTLLYRDEGFRETFRYSIQGVGLMPLFYYAITMHDSKLFSWLNSKWMMKIGVYSYSMYLIHFLLNGFVKQNKLTNNHFLELAFVLGISLIFAYLMDVYIEPHFKAIRKRYRH